MPGLRLLLIGLGLQDELDRALDVHKAQRTTFANPVTNSESKLPFLRLTSSSREETSAMHPEIERIDETDSKILNLMQQDARISNAALARELGMAPSAILERVRKLEERGLIRGYEARLNAAALGWGLLAFVFVRVDEPLRASDTAVRLAEIPEVQEVHNIAGEDCYLVKLRVRDTEALAKLLRNEFGRIETIRSTRTTIVLETVSERATLPIGGTNHG